MNKVSEIVFIYSIVKNTCYIQASNQLIRELTIKGSCEYQGKVNGTWFQIDELISHWISFRCNRFQANKWEVFYKRIDERVVYYRKVFYQVERMLAFSFSERDEWIKDPMSGRWQNKYKS
jgi:hypothetical protein